MIVIGFDPSVTGFGYAVIETGRHNALKKAGVWETWPDRAFKGVMEDNNGRFAYLAQQLWEFVNETKPERIFVEGLVYMRNTNFAAISTAARSRGLVDLVAAALNVETIELSAAEVKKSLGIITKKSEGLASKSEVRTAICRIYANAGDMVPATKVGENISDAIAVAHVGIQKAAFTDKLQSGSSW